MAEESLKKIMENRDTLNVEMSMEFESMTNEGEKFMEVFGEVRDSFRQIAGALSRIAEGMEKGTKEYEEKLMKNIKAELENSQSQNSERSVQ